MGDGRKPTRKRWSPVTRALWTDERFCGLSSAGPCSQTLWLYLLTGPEQGVIPGLFVSGTGSLADRLSGLDDRWTYDEVNRCLSEIKDAGMLRINARPALFWLPRAHRHRPPPNPNQIVGWLAAYNELPECDLREEALATIGADLQGKAREAFLSAFPDASGWTPAPAVVAARGGGQTLPQRVSGSPVKAGDKAPPRGHASTHALSTAPDAATKARKRSRQRALNPSAKGSETLSVTKNKNKNKNIPDEPRRLAGELLEAICSHLPELRGRVKPNHLALWALDIEKLIRLDGADPVTVERLIRLIHRQGHPSVVFWRANVLSGRKLRERYTQILAQARQGGALSAAGDSASPWHARHASALRRLRDKLEQQRKELTADAVTVAAPNNDKPTRAQAESAVEWMRGRR